LDKIGLLSRIYTAVTAIDSGRKGFATRGVEQEGRILFEQGIAEAMSVFKEAAATKDPEIMLLAEYTFVIQELELCQTTDKETRTSLTKAIQKFDDAFLALKAVSDQHYTISEQIFPHDSDYRYSGFPKDSFHIACHSHKVRVKNFLSTPGTDPLEKALLEQRRANMPVAQESYAELQKKALK
jgi:hypothetical protein